MDLMTIAVAGIAALAILLIAFGVASSGSSGISDRLERAFDRLAPDDRLILWLHHYEGHSLADIGGRLGISDKTAKSRLFAARRRLQSALEAEDR